MSATLQVILQPPRAAPLPAAELGSEPAGPDLLPSLAGQSVIVRAARDQEIFGQGDPAEYCYLIVSGCVRTVSLMEDGRRQVSEFLLPGDLFGWEAMHEHDFAAEAVTPVTLRRYRRRSLEALADANNDVARTLRRLSASQLRAARERIVLLGRKSATERIASFLLDMAGRLHAPAQIQLPMNRADIADYLGLTIETVCRGLTQLRREGTIGVERGRVAIRDLRALGLAGCAVLH
jgi:CRP/FNR family transcriptional regulator, nitrogen fixation regulation protein